MKKSRSGYEETLGSNLVELPADGANDSTNEPPLTNGVKESTPLEDLATLVETNHAEGSNESVDDLYRFLGESASLKMKFVARTNALQPDQLCLSVAFQNTTAFPITSLEFDVVDSTSIRLQRDPDHQGKGEDSPIRVPFSLPPLVGGADDRRVPLEYQFYFKVAEIQSPVRLKGNVTYMRTDRAGSTDEGATQEQIHFKLNLPTSTFIQPVPCSGDEFASLLASGDLTEKTASKVSLPNSTDTSASNINDVFDGLLRKICASCNLSVVEKVDTNASLHASSLQRHPVCILVKLKAADGGEGGELSINGKSTSASILNNVVEEIKACV